MPDFDALGRDVSAAADSVLDTAPALAVKQLWAWAGFDQGDNPNHLWSVSVSSDPGGFSVTAVVKDENVYTPEPVVSPSTPQELAAADAASARADEDDPAPVTPEPVDEPAPAEEASAPDASEDPPVEASSDESSDTTSTSTTDASAS